MTARAAKTDPSGIRNCTIKVDGVEVFYREAGPRNAPVLLLFHGYPASSHQFRHLLPLLSDRWRVIAPDFPGFGQSETPEDFRYTFDSYWLLMESLVAALRLGRYAIYLHDYGAQVGLRLAAARPDRVSALIVQNGDIYVDTLGPQYDDHKSYFSEPTDENLRSLQEAISLEGFRQEFIGGLSDELVRIFPAEMWNLHWAQMTERRKAVALELMVGLRDNADHFARFQAYLRNHQPPTLIIWGPQNGYMREDAARAWLRDLPGAELHILEAGHWLLETNLGEATALIREFLGRVHA